MLIPIVLLVLGLTAPSVVSHAQHADLSGHWVVLENPKTPNISGAAFNCGAECVITQAETSLRVALPATPDGKKPADVTILIDGAIAKWDGNALLVTRQLGPIATSQKITIAGDTMTVVTSFAPGDTPPVTLRYSRRPSSH